MPPMCEIGRVGNSKMMGPLARFDDHRHKRAIPVSLHCLGAHPAGHHGTRRPEHDRGLSLAEGALNAFVERLA